MPELDSNKSSTALRAISVLEFLAEKRRGVSVAEVAEAIEADRSTAYRMLMTLRDAGYVDRDESGKTYALGYKLLTLSGALLRSDGRSELINRALRGLSDLTGETVHYCVFDRDASVLVHRAKGSQLVSVDFQIGDRSPLHCTSIGKALLAYQDVRIAEEIIAGGLKPLTARTITDPAALRQELARVRAQGFAFDDLEFHDDMRCVAVPLFENGGVRGGISLSGPSSRYTLDKLHELKDQALAAAQELSERLNAAS